MYTHIIRSPVHFEHPPTTYQNHGLVGALHTLRTIEWGCCILGDRIVDYVSRLFPRCSRCFNLFGISISKTSKNIISHMLFKSDHTFYFLFLTGGLVGGVNPSHEYMSQSGSSSSGQVGLNVVTHSWLRCILTRPTMVFYDISN
jgi:hypothetical protein